MVESDVNSDEDLLTESLQVKSPPGGRVMRQIGERYLFLIAFGDGWLDLGPISLVYALTINASIVASSVPHLRTAAGPWPFFRRARRLAGGAVVDDIDYDHRVHEMRHILIREKPS